MKGVSLMVPEKVLNNPKYLITQVVPIDLKVTKVKSLLSKEDVL